MNLHLNVMRGQSYYHILDFRNYNHNKQEKGNESIKYETDANIFEKSVPKKPMPHKNA